MKTKIKVSRTAGKAQSSSQIVDDLLIQILLHLPIRSLIRFKSVSNHWNSLIDDPRFCLLRNPNPNPAVGIFLHGLDFWHNPLIGYVPFSGMKSTNFPPFRKPKFIQDSLYIKIVQSCNGLFLCSCIRICERYYVYNPTINKFSTLPKLDGEGDLTWSTICGMNLAFDPAKSPHYKVFCVRILELDLAVYRYQLEVYSSETGGPWRKCGEPFIAQANLKNGVYWNRAIHWTSNGTGDSLYFNIDDQMLRIMPIPPIGRGDENDYYFEESCDHLHYMVNIICPPIVFNVYEMRRDYSEWFVKYRVDLSTLVAAYTGMTRSNFRPGDWRSLRSYDIVSLVRGEKDEDSFLVLNIEGKAIRYNIVHQTFETIFEFSGGKIEGSFYFCCSKGFEYIESLCCV